jgi:hypothetical protein
VDTGTIELASTVRAPREARRWLAARTIEWGLSGQLRADALSLVNALVSTAVSNTTGERTIELQLTWDGSLLWLAVADGVAVRPVARQLSHVELLGLDVHSVLARAQQWGSEEYQGGRRVWFGLRPDAHPGAGVASC